MQITIIGMTPMRLHAFFWSVELPVSLEIVNQLQKFYSKHYQIPEYLTVYMMARVHNIIEEVYYELLMTEILVLTNNSITYYNLSFGFFITYFDLCPQASP